MVPLSCLLVLRVQEAPPDALGQAAPSRSRPGSLRQQEAVGCEGRAAPGRKVAQGWATQSQSWRSGQVSLGSVAGRPAAGRAKAQPTDVPGEAAADGRGSGAPTPE